MKRFGVTMPITGYFYKEVEAETEEEALEKICEDGYCDEDICEMDIHENVVQGNVFYGVLNSMEIEDLGEVD